MNVVSNMATALASTSSKTTVPTVGASSSSNHLKCSNVLDNKNLYNRNNFIMDAATAASHQYHAPLSLSSSSNTKSASFSTNSDYKYFKNENFHHNFSSTNNNNTNNIQSSHPQVQQYHHELIFQLDDLVWAKLNNHPWWPCKIVKDNLNSFFKINGEKLMYYVEFIGPFKERTWVLDLNIFKYDGIESFKTYAQNQVDRAVTKSDKEKLAERFQLKVALNRREQWQKAVDQADYLNRLYNSQNQNGFSVKRKLDVSINLKEETNSFNPLRLPINSDNNSKVLSNLKIENENSEVNFSNKKTKHNQNGFNSDKNCHILNNLVKQDFNEQLSEDGEEDDKNEEIEEGQEEEEEESEQNMLNYNHDNLVENRPQNSFYDLNHDNEDKNQIDWDLDISNNNTTISSIINEQKSLNKSMSIDRMSSIISKKKRGRKPKSPTQIVQNINIINQCPDNELKFKIKLTNNQIQHADTFSTNSSSKKSKKQKLNRSRSSSSCSSSSSSSSSSASSTSRSSCSRSSSNCSSSSSSSNSSSTDSSSSASSSTSSSCSTSNNQDLKRTSLSKLIKKAPSTASSWSTSSELDRNSHNPQQSSNLTSSYSDTYSDIEKINLKKQNARKTSTSFSISSSSTPSKKKQIPKAPTRRRNSKSLSDQSSIDLNQNSLLFDENNLLNSAHNFNESIINSNGGNSTPETYLIDRYKYAVRHIKQGLSVEEACNKYRISKGALLKCLSGGTAPRGKKTRLTESEENEIVEWLINYKDLKYNDAIHLVFEQVAQKFEQAQRPNPFNNGKPSMDWWYDFLSRHPQIMASKPDWLMRGKVNDQYIKDVQSGQLKCTKFRRALLSAIQYIRSLNDGANISLSELASASALSQAGSTASTSKSKSSTSKLNNNQLKENCSQKSIKTSSSNLKSKATSRPIHIKREQESFFIQSSPNEQIIKRRSPSTSLNQVSSQQVSLNLQNSFTNQTNLKPLKNNNYSLDDNANLINNLIQQNANNSNCSSNTTSTTSNSLNIDFIEEDLSSVSPISLLNTSKPNQRALVNTQHQQQNSLNNNYFVSGNINKTEEMFSQSFLNVNGEDLSENEDDDDENLNQVTNEENNEDDTNANVTFHTEIFNSELDENNFEDLINPNELIEKESTAHRQHNNYLNHHTNSIYIKPNNQDTTDYLFNSNNQYNNYNLNHHHHQNQIKAQSLLLMNNHQMLNIPPSSSYNQIYHAPPVSQNIHQYNNQQSQIQQQHPHHNHHHHHHHHLHHHAQLQQQNHLIVPDDDDENEDEQNVENNLHLHHHHHHHNHSHHQNSNLINHDDDDDLMRDTIDPSAFLP